MKTYLVTTKVVLYETWEVEAENKEEAQKNYHTEGDLYFDKHLDKEIVEMVEVENLKSYKTIFSKPVELGLEPYHRSLKHD